LIQQYGQERIERVALEALGFPLFMANTIAEADAIQSAIETQ